MIVEVPGVLQIAHVGGLRDHDELRAGDPFVDQPGVGGGGHNIVFSHHDKSRDSDLSKGLARVHS